MKRTSRTEARKPAAAVHEGQVAPLAEPDLTLTAYDALADSQSFDEPVQGMQMRELLVPSLFRRFFGAVGAAGPR